MKNYFVLLIVLFAGCTTTPDFKSFPKIDAHVHLETSDDSFVQIVDDINFKFLTLVTGSVSQELIAKEFGFARKLYDKHPETIGFATTFSMDGFGEPYWQEKTIAWLQDSFDAGAIAVKIWKDIGMTFRNEDSTFILIDDPRFDPIFDFIESNNKTLVNHNGEPKNCWLPVDAMTVRGDSSYFTNHPEYHMYLHPEYPSYDELLAARDRMLIKHPDLRYVGCHLGSMEWDVDEQAKWLDKFPNCAIDMAARISHFKVQDRDKVRDFIIKYQDQLLYGTDIGIRYEENNAQNMEAILNNARDIWLNDWEYFTTDHILTQNDKVKEYKGLKLPTSVLKKIYFKNAMRMYPGFGSQHSRN
jgi:predicted TIM-barrel fold metal-dependent hydrolase